MFVEGGGISCVPHCLGVLLHCEQNAALSEISLDYTTRSHLITTVAHGKPNLVSTLTTSSASFNASGKCYQLRVRVSLVVVPTWIRQIAFD